MRGQRCAEIALDDMADVVDVLLRQWPVEPEFAQQSFAARRIHAAFAGQILDRVPWNQMNQRKRKERHADERRYDQRGAAQDEGEHEGLRSGFRGMTRLSSPRR